MKANIKVWVLMKNNKCVALKWSQERKTIGLIWQGKLLWNDLQNSKWMLPYLLNYFYCPLLNNCPTSNNRLVIVGLMPCHATTQSHLTQEIHSSRLDPLLNDCLYKEGLERRCDWKRLWFDTGKSKGPLIELKQTAHWTDWRLRLHMAFKKDFIRPFKSKPNLYIYF